MARDDIWRYLDSHRRSEESDPLHKWIGTYNLRRVYLLRFFKWFCYPELEQKKRQIYKGSGLFVNAKMLFGSKAKTLSNKLIASLYFPKTKSETASLVKLVLLLA